MADERIEVGTAVAEREPPRALALPDVGHLMEMALAHGQEGAEALERLVTLQERIMDRHAQNALSDALAAFQAECPQIRQSETAKIATKSGANYSFTYAPLDEITRTIRPALERHGLSYSWDSALDGPMLTVTCTVRHRDGATVSATFACPTDSMANISAAQKTGAALTYAKRQSITAVFGLSTTTADADAAGELLDSEPIDSDELAELQTLVDGAGADVRRMCAFFEVPALADLPASRLGEARKLLRAKAAKL
jgi:hypothetical protein